MSDDNSAQEPTNFPVGNRDEVPSESPEKVKGAETTEGKVVPNDHPERDVAEAKAAREGDKPADDGPADGTPRPGAAAAGAGGDSIESPGTDPNRANAKPAADSAADQLNK